MWRGDKTPLVRGGGRRAGLSACSLRPPEQLLLLAPVWGGEGGVDLGFFLFEKHWKIVWWQMPWMGRTFLPKTPSASPLFNP